MHVSKVKSLQLDKWEPESIEVMLKLGNTRTNQIYEAKLIGNSERLANSSSWERFVLKFLFIFGLGLFISYN